MLMPKLEEVDRKRATGDGKGSIRVGMTYLVLYDGNFYTGHFILGLCNLRFEPQNTPGWFDSIRLIYLDEDPKWQGIWRIKNAGNIIKRVHDA